MATDMVTSVRACILFPLFVVVFPLELVEILSHSLQSKQT